MAKLKNILKDVSVLILEPNLANIPTRTIKNNVIIAKTKNIVLSNFIYYLFRKNFKEFKIFYVFV